MRNLFPEIKKNFGFGMMRLPEKDGKIDRAVTCEMVDLFLKSGFNYFDTAKGYHSGDSEKAIKDCLTSRYPREAYVLADKLSHNFFETEADLRPLFDEQLKACGVEYFDFYLMHAQSADNFEKYKKCRAYETAFALKEEGKIKHVGISFHDKPEVLEEILTAFPQVEFVQLQINYLDMEDANVQARRCMDICRKRNKPVIAMEPVKGGHLANLPAEADNIFRELNCGSNAAVAIRYAAGLEGVFMTLSGMSNPDMMKENTGFMEKFHPLGDKESEAMMRVCGILKGLTMIDCTTCRYCTDSCPIHIPIPNIFTCMNAKRVFASKSGKTHYDLYTAGSGKASDCIECGNCETICPQHLPIRELLKEAVDEFEK